MDVRRLVSRLEGSAVEPVKAMSVMGSMFTDLAVGDATAPTVDESNDGGSFDAVYNGILGSVFCASDDCKTDATGNLTGSWYFTPD